MSVPEQSELLRAPVQAGWELDGFALSPPQRTAWAQIHSCEGGPVCHAISASLTKCEAVDVERLSKRLESLVRTHEIFRTRYRRHPGLNEPLQTVCDWDEHLVRLHVVDWSSERSESLEPRKEQLWNQVLATPVDSGISAYVAIMSGNQLYLILAMTPLSADHRSLLRLLAHAVEAGPTLSGDILQYSDVAAWLLDLSEADEAESSRRFWQDTLSPRDSHSWLALDARGEWSLDSVRALLLTVPKTLATAIQIRAARLEIAEEDFYFASWVLLLRTMSGNEHLPPVARIFDGVSDPAIEATLGLLERQLPLAMQADGVAADRDVLKQITSACARMRDLQDFFPARAVRAEPYAFQFLSVPEIAANVEAIRCVHAPFRVRASVLRHGHSDESASISVTFEYPHAALSEQAVSIIAEQWLSLLSGMAYGEEDAPFRLWLSESFQQRILSLGRGELRALSSPANVVSWMEASCAQGECGSVVLDHCALSLFEINERATRAAQFLRRAGVGTGDIVGLYLPRGIEYLVAMLAVLKSGAAYMPMDVDYPIERLKYMVESAAPALIVAAQGAAADALGAARVLTAEALERLAAESPETSMPAVELRADDAAYVLYTSGSTGKPKGVVIPHGALFNHMRWMVEQFRFDRRDIFLQRTSASFDASVWELWAPLLVGGRMIIARQDKMYDLAYLLGLMKSHRVTVAQFVPSMLEMLTEYPELGGIASLRMVFVGGEALTAALKRKYFNRGSADLCNLYGPTEACIDATFQICSRNEDARTCIGKPIHNTGITVVDLEGRLAGIGVSGEICISGAGLFKGYLHRADLTVEKVFTPCFSTEPHYRTGDLARLLEDGTIEYLGRIDEQVKLRGYRIELAEIDRVMEQQASVRRAVTILDSGNRLVTVAQVDAAAFSADAAIEGARRQLPDYMVPSDLVTIERLPMLPNGKLDRGRLRRLVDEKRESSAFAAPSTDLHRTLADIWSRVLKRDRIGVTDRFFSVGGDSIRSIQVVYEASLVGLSFSVMDLFKHQTIEALSAHLQGGPRVVEQACPIEPLNPAPQALRSRFADCYPATPMQRYMLDAYAADTARRGIFHAQQSFRVFMPRFYRSALTQALAIAADAVNFKTGFVLEGGEAYQVLLPDRAVRAEVLDVSGLRDTDSGRAIRNAIEQDRLLPFDPFDLSTPLMRIRLFVQSDDHFELFLSNHHAIQDGWGNVEFLNKVAESYQRIVSGEAVHGDPQRGNVCKEFALLQHALAQDAKQIQFWRGEAERLATDSPRSHEADEGDLRSFSCDLDIGLAKALYATSERSNVTIKAILLTACIETLERLGLGSTLGIVSNGRNEELSDPLGAMGLFWNLMPFAPKRAAAAGWARCVEIQEQLILLEPYSRFALREIEALAGRRPLFHTTFNFINFHNQARLVRGGTASMHGTHALDNFGFPLGITLAGNEGMEFSMLLQQNTSLPLPLDALAREFLQQIEALVGSATAGG